MLNDLTPMEQDLVESLYQQLIKDLRSVGGQKGQVRLVYSHKAGRVVTIRSSDSRFEQCEDDPNYEIIATYSGVPAPRIGNVAGDVLAHFNEKAQS